MPRTVRIVTRAITGAAWTGVPSGTSSSMSKAIGMTVTGSSMITVPETAGVSSRRNSGSRADTRSCNRAEITTSVASIAGPPSATAVTLIPTKALELPMTSMWPPPIRPKRTACSAVVRPLIATAANTAQATRDSEAPAIRITAVGSRIGTVTVIRPSCRPRPAASAAGGWSSAS